MSPALVDIQEWSSKQYYLYKVKNISNEPVNVKLDQFFLNQNVNADQKFHQCTLFFSNPAWVTLDLQNSLCFKIYCQEEYQNTELDVQDHNKTVKVYVQPHFSISSYCKSFPEIQKEIFFHTLIYYNPKPFGLHLNVQVEK